MSSKQSGALREFLFLRLDLGTNKNLGPLRRAVSFMWDLKRAKLVS